MRNELKMLTGIILLIFSISSVYAMAAEKKVEAAGNRPKSDDGVIIRIETNAMVVLTILANVSARSRHFMK